MKARMDHAARSSSAQPFLAKQGSREAESTLGEGTRLCFLIKSESATSATCFSFIQMGSIILHVRAKLGLGRLITKNRGIS